MTKNKFIACYICKYLDKCKVAKSRLDGVDYNSPVIQDIGCFGHEIYAEQISDKQMKLF